MNINAFSGSRYVQMTGLMTVFVPKNYMKHHFLVLQMVLGSTLGGVGNLTGKSLKGTQEATGDFPGRLARNPLLVGGVSKNHIEMVHFSLLWMGM